MLYPVYGQQEKNNLEYFIGMIVNYFELIRRCLPADLNTGGKNEQA